MADSRRIPDPFAEKLAAKATAVRSLRYLLVATIIVVVALYVTRVGSASTAVPVRVGAIEVGLVLGWQWIVLFGAVLAGAVIAVDVLTPSKKISTLSGVVLGLIVGIIAAAGVGILVNLLAEVYGLKNEPVAGAIKLFLGIALTYLAVSIVLQTQDDFRLVIPYVEFARQVRGTRPLLVDTSLLVDGRLLDLAETGVLQAPLVIPRFVLDELHALSDSQDKLKRARGKRGLELVSRLQKSPALDVTIDGSEVQAKSVDQMIVELARRLSAIVLTTDSGLNRVATIQGVAAVNLVDVANALKPRFLPGESATLRLIKPGEQPTQGVGYLEDGTMVVVEDGAPHVGEEVTATVMSSIQTTAGRMLFARIGDAAPEHVPAPRTDDQPDAPALPADEPGPAREPRSPFPPTRPDRSRSGTRNPRRG